MTTPEQSDDELFSRVVDGVAEENDYKELASRLQSNSTADNFFVFLYDHATLRSYFKTKGFESRVHAEVDRSARMDREKKRSIIKFASLQAITAAAAASIALVAAGVWTPWPAVQPAELADSQAADQWSPTASDGVRDIARPIVATLSGIVDCVWSEGHAAKPYASALTTGETIALSEGVAQVTFESGAKVIVKGPCDFRIVDAMASELAYGDISAVAPTSASGFQVITPSSRVVDIGTAFGVSVDSDGASDIHVFEGEVLASAPLRGDLPITRVSLKTNEALAYQVGATEGVSIPSNRTKFEFNLEDRIHAAQRPEALVGEGLAMWLRADLGVVLDLNGRVVAWQDLLEGDNTSADDAMQPFDHARPVLWNDGFHGRPVVRFDGRSAFLMTPPMASKSSQTIVLVASIGSESTGSGQIFSYQGPPKQILPRPIDYGFVEIDAYGNDSPTFRALVYAGFKGPDPVDSGSVSCARNLEFNRPYVFTYRYDHHSGQAQLYINGDLEGESSAPISAAVTSRRVIGKHGIDGDYYAGDIAELLVWDRSLSDDELADMNQYLQSQYFGDGAR